MARYCLPLPMPPETVLYAVADRDADTGRIYAPTYYKKREARDADFKRRVDAYLRDKYKTYGIKFSRSSADPHFHSWDTTVAKVFTVAVPKIK